MQDHIEFSNMVGSRAAPPAVVLKSRAGAELCRAKLLRQHMAASFSSRHLPQRIIFHSKSDGPAKSDDQLYQRQVAITTDVIARCQLCRFLVHGMAEHKTTCRRGRRERLFASSTYYSWVAPFRDTSSHLHSLLRPRSLVFRLTLGVTQREPKQQ